MKRSFRETLEEKRGAPAESENAGLGAEELINKYSGMSEKELVKELKGAAARQRAEGRFDEAAVKKGMDAIMPMLDENQKRKLRELIGML